MTLTLNSYMKQNLEDTASRVIDGEAIIINLDSGIYYSLNEVGTAIWELADGNRTIREIAKAICDEYAVDHEEAEKDTLEVVNDLVGQGLVIVGESPFSA